jgi:hypothetical protein
MHLLRNLQLDVSKNVVRSSHKAVPMSDFTKIAMCPKVVVGVLNANYHENSSDQSCAVPYGQTYGQI